VDARSHTLPPLCKQATASSAHAPGLTHAGPGTHRQTTAGGPQAGAPTPAHNVAHDVGVVAARQEVNLLLDGEGLRWVGVGERDDLDGHMLVVGGVPGLHHRAVRAPACAPGGGGGDGSGGGGVARAQCCT